MVSCEIAQVKYLGGITFLLKDRCPEYASDFEISNYKQCVQNEILFVSKYLGKVLLSKLFLFISKFRLYSRF